MVAGTCGRNGRVESRRRVCTVGRAALGWYRCTSVAGRWPITGIATRFCFVCATISGIDLLLNNSRRCRVLRTAGLTYDLVICIFVGAMRIWKVNRYLNGRAALWECVHENSQSEIVVAVALQCWPSDNLFQIHCVMVQPSSTVFTSGLCSRWIRPLGIRSSALTLSMSQAKAVRIDYKVVRQNAGDFKQYNISYFYLPRFMISTHSTAVYSQLGAVTEKVRVFLIQWFLLLFIMT